MDVPVGDSLLGRVINPLGWPLDGLGPVSSQARLPIERTARPLMDREPVSEPLQTGIKAIDAMIPIGRGQRELIIGDRKTGKTAIAVDTILNQRDKNVLCVYCSIGQRASAVAKVIETLRTRHALEYTTVVVSEGNEPAGLAYIAPYAATSIAEYFMEQGRDVLIVYDDLTHHARAYRELSLLLKRPPGREAFPGDIFYLHSRLLERATHLKPSLGGGSLTALPVIETEAQNIAAYIPTNLISITDGQIYLSPTMFELGYLPAINVGKSVSRVGGKAQRPGFRSVAGDLKLSFAQFEELENFTRFGARLDEATHQLLAHGQRIRAILTQAEHQTVPVLEQLVTLLSLAHGLFDELPLERVAEAEHLLRQASAALPSNLKSRLSQAERLNEDEQAEVKEWASQVLTEMEAKG
jgi:F-type H+-transporting ATPase subunit alpha